MQSNKKTGLFFGSFNPVHIGHMAIANYMVEFTSLGQVWFVVSRQNPLKDKIGLLPEYHRLELVNLAIGDDLRFRASNIEFKLPEPSYTINTLTYLGEKYPEREFALIMGADNFVTLPKWKNYREIIDHYVIYIYPRPGISLPENLLASYIEKGAKIEITNTPLMEISSSFIRSAIKAGKEINYFLPEKVYTYIKEMHFFEKRNSTT